MTWSFQIVRREGQRGGMLYIGSKTPWSCEDRSWSCWRNPFL